MKTRKKYKIIRDSQMRESIVRYAQQGKGYRWKAVAKYGISMPTLKRWCGRLNKGYDIGVKDRNREVKIYEEKNIYRDALLLWLERGQPKHFSEELKEEVRQLMLDKLSPERLKGRKIHNTCIWRLLKYAIAHQASYHEAIQEKTHKKYEYSFAAHKYKISEDWAEDKFVY